MNSLTTISVLLMVVFIGLIILDLIKIKRLRARKVHDRILYQFCATRDIIAQMAITGVVSEESEIFQFLYVQNAKMIRKNRDAGLRFRRLVLGALGDNGDFAKERHRILGEELENADLAVRYAAHRWTRAYLIALGSSMHIVFLMKASVSIWKSVQAVLSLLSFVTWGRYNDVTELVATLDRAAGTSWWISGKRFESESDPSVSSLRYQN